MCMGSQFAKSVVFLILSHILQRFTLKFPDNEPKPSLEPDYFFFVRPKPYKVCAVAR